MKQDDFMQKVDDKFYTAYITCSNCGYMGNIQIVRGNTINSQDCPHCGCQTISGSGNREKPVWTEHIMKG
jgi:Zn ribbon nucleic-acid-binding protein